MKNAIGYFRRDKSGCWWYRTKQPMEMLNSKGLPTRIIELNQDVKVDDLAAFHFYGATSFSFWKVLKFLKEEGIKIVYDTDDALDYIDESNPFYYAVKKDVGSVNEIIDFADKITVSTPAMAEYMKQKSGKDSTVITNCFTPSEWTYPRPKREGIRIGFAGSATHVPDLIEIIPIIERLQQKYPITFIIMGFGQQDYDSWYKGFRYSAPQEASKYLAELDRRLSKIKFEWVPFIDFDKYPVSLINMSLDIGLCPLKETKFNKHRSACKAMEYTLAGALALASDTEPYRLDKSSILVKDDQWEDTLVHFIESPEGRAHEVKKHQDWIRENRNIESQFDLLKSVYL